MNGNRKEPSSAFTWRGTRVDLSSDFAAGEEEGNSISAGSQPQEVLVGEVEDDNGVDSELASYRRFRAGGALSEAGTDQQGRWFGDFRDGGDVAIDDRTEVRLVKRPKNGDSRTPLSDWQTIREMDNSDPRFRPQFPPATDDDGDPLVVQSGDIIALEIRNTASAITFSRANSTVEIPAQVGY